MNKGLWIWPAESKGQKIMLQRIASSTHLMTALQGIAKSKEGLSNSELDELLADNSNWITLWAIRQLLALGFIEYKVDFFGGPARYITTELGKTALGIMTGQSTKPATVAPIPPAIQPVPSKTA
jgi:hypothetical protein